MQFVQNCKRRKAKTPARHSDSLRWNAPNDVNDCDTSGWSYFIISYISNVHVCKWLTKTLMLCTQFNFEFILCKQIENVRWLRDLIFSFSFGHHFFQSLADSRKHTAEMKSSLFSASSEFSSYFIFAVWRWA